MLRRNNDCVHTHGNIVVIFDGDLGLSVRTQIGKRTVFAHGGQLFGKGVRKGDRQRHQLRCFIARIAENHTLVARAGIKIVFHIAAFCLQRLINAHGNITGLLMDGIQHSAGITVKAVFCAVISDFTHGISDNGRNIDIALGRDFPHDHNHTGRCAGLAGNAAHGVLAEQAVQNGIGNLVADLIGMSFRDGFGCEKYFFHVGMLLFFFW